MLCHQWVHFFALFILFCSVYLFFSVLLNSIMVHCIIFCSIIFCFMSLYFILFCFILFNSTLCLLQLKWEWSVIQWHRLCHCLFYSLFYSILFFGLQLKRESSVTQLHRLRQCLLEQMILMLDQGHTPSEGRAIKGSAFIRLYCALKSLAAFK